MTVVDCTRRVRAFTTDLENALVASHFYDAPVDGMPTDWLENAFSGIEGRASAALRTIDGGMFPPQGEALDALVTFVALSIVRTPHVQAQAPVTYETWVLNGPVPTREEMAGEFELMFGRWPTTAELDEVVRSLAETRATQTPFPRRGANYLLPWMLRRMEQMIRRRSWHLLAFPDEAALLTADVPVAFNLVDRTRPPTFESCEEISMPIDPHHALFILTDDPPPDAHRDGTADLARSLNQLIIRQCARWVVHHPATSPLDGLDLTSPLRPEWP